MVDNVVVTLRYGKHEFDMEFPAEIPIGQIRPLLIRALQQKGVLIAEPFNLFCSDHILNDSETFLGSGVWDGSYLELICGGKQ